MAVDTPHRSRGLFRSLTVSLLVGIACLSVALLTVVHWVEQQILTTDNWVALVSPLPKQPVVSTALSSYITEQVFNEPRVQKKVTEALPPKAEFLASPLTDQLKSATTKVAKRLVVGDVFQSIWTTANRLAMNRLTTTARGQTPPLQSRINQRFNINLNGVKSELGGRLGDVKKAIPALDQKNDQAITLSASLKQRPQKVRQYVRATDFLADVLPFLTLSTVLGALALARHRRKTFMIVAGVTIGLLLIELIAVKILRQQIIGGVHNPSYQSAVEYVYNVFANSLRNTVNSVLIMLFIVFLLCVLAGPARLARSIRSYIHIDRLHHSKVAMWLNGLRLWVRHARYYLWLGVVVLTLLYLAFWATINWRVVINSILFAISLMAFIQLIAVPRRLVPQKT